MSDANLSSVAEVQRAATDWRLALQAAACLMKIRRVRDCDIVAAMVVTAACNGGNRSVMQRCCLPDTVWCPLMSSIA
ncbi:hypothetical protein PF003_g722 [Phytophthora fragariae]|nr:hypothetical protein PF003_g722 [Phytophthora fragariae]